MFLIDTSPLSTAFLPRDSPAGNFICARSCLGPTGYQVVWLLFPWPTKSVRAFWESHYQGFGELFRNVFKTVTQCLNIDIEGKKLLEFTAHAGVCFKCFALIMKAASSKFSDPANLRCPKIFTVVSGLLCSGLLCLTCNLFKLAMWLEMTAASFTSFPCTYVTLIGNN